MWLHDVCCLKGPLACFGVCNKAVKIILFENILDSQGEQGECINESSGDLLVGSTLILQTDTKRWESSKLGGCWMLRGYWVQGCGCR